jgi:transposase
MIVARKDRRRDKLVLICSTHSPRPSLSIYSRAWRFWPETVIVQDGASPHSHNFQKDLYSYSEIQKVFWPGNSLDLNMIEPVWAPLKRETIKNGTASTIEEAIKHWKKAWPTIQQKMLQ